MGVYALIVGGITLALTVQIIRDAFSPTVTPQARVQLGSLEQRCSQAVAPLWDALLRARRSAAEATSEQAAVNVFREQLNPEWSRLPDARGACEPDATSAEGLAELVRLRFEEEHAVRFEARGLAVARQQVSRWVKGLGEPPKRPATER